MNFRFLGAIGLITYVSGTCAAESSVTLYGLIDMGVSSTHVHDAGGVDRRATGLTSGGLSDSLIGLKGRETLSNGWAATFQLESLFDGTTGFLSDEHRFFSNSAWLGLASDQFGELRLGLQHTVGQQFGGELEIASWKEMGMGATFKASDNHQLKNTVSYVSPSWSGVSFGLGYSFDAVGDQVNGRKSPAISVALKYQQDSLLLIATWDKAYLSDSALPDRGRPEAWQLGGAYDFEMMKVSLAWSRQKNGYAGLNGGDPDNLGLGLGAADFVRGGDLDAYLLGVAIPVGGAGTVLAQWSIVKPRWTWQDGSKPATGQVATLGYVYELSPRSKLYAMAGLAKRYSLDDQIVQGQGTTTRYMAGFSHDF